MSVGRDGASDAVSFLRAGVPAVEFGPTGAGHHGPEEWVSIILAEPLPPGADRLRAPAAGQARPGRPGRGRHAAARGRGRTGVRKRYLQDEERVPSVGAALVKRGLLAMVLVVIDERDRARHDRRARDRRRHQDLPRPGPRAGRHPGDHQGRRRRRPHDPAARLRRPLRGQEARRSSRARTRCCSSAPTPNKDAIAVMSIPRDLKAVEIPGHGRDKINAAFEHGGERLTVRTIKKLFERRDGQGLPDQQRHQRRVRLLPQGRRLHRRRLRRHRPRLLQRQHARRRALRRDRRQRRLPEAQGQGRAGLRPLPPHRQRLHPRRPPAGLPAPGAQPVGRASGCSRSASARSSRGRSAATSRSTRASAPTRRSSRCSGSRCTWCSGARASTRSASAPTESDNPTVDTRLFASDESLRKTVGEFMNAKSSAKPTATSKPTPEDKESARLRKKRNRNKSAAVPGLEEARPQGVDQAVLADPKLKFPFYFPTLRTDGRRATRAPSRGSTASATSRAASTRPTAWWSPRGSPASTTACRA